MDRNAAATPGSPKGCINDRLADKTIQTHAIMRVRMRMMCCWAFVSIITYVVRRHKTSPNRQRTENSFCGSHHKATAITTQKGNVKTLPAILFCSLLCFKRDQIKIYELSIMNWLIGRRQCLCGSSCPGTVSAWHWRNSSLGLPPCPSHNC